MDRVCAEVVGGDKLVPRVEEDVSGAEVVAAANVSAGVLLSITVDEPIGLEVTAVVVSCAWLDVCVVGKRTVVADVVSSRVDCVG